jgi:NlpC/P60 family protein
MWSFNTAFGATTNFAIGNPVQYQSANSQYNYTATISVTKADLIPGDLLFFNYEHGVDPQTGRPKDADHVAMYVGGDDVLEAYTCSSSLPTGNYVIRSSKATRDATDPITGQALPPCVVGTTRACFVGFRRIPATTAPPRLRIATHSPVTLDVTDPDGLSITAATVSLTDREVLREVGNALYYVEDRNSDDTVISPIVKPGAYFIRVAPKPAALPTDSYSLTVEADGAATTLADHASLASIPTEATES